MKPGITFHILLKEFHHIAMPTNMKRNGIRDGKKHESNAHSKFGKMKKKKKICKYKSWKWFSSVRMIFVFNPELLKTFLSNTFSLLEAENRWIATFKNNNIACNVSVSTKYAFGFWKQRKPNKKTKFKKKIIGLLLCSFDTQILRSEQTNTKRMNKCTELIRAFHHSYTHVHTTYSIEIRI